MILFLLLFGCDLPTAQADTNERNSGVMRVEFRDAVCFCAANGGHCYTQSGISCIVKPPPTVEEGK